MILKSLRNISLISSVSTMIVGAAVFVPTSKGYSEMLDLEISNHFYIDKEHIGELNDKEKATALLNNNLKLTQEQFPEFSLFYANDIDWVEEAVFRLNHEDSLNIDNLYDQLEIVTEASAVSLNGEIFGYFPGEMKTETFLRKLVEPFLQQNNTILNPEDKMNLEDLKVGETLVSDISVNPSLELKKVNIAPENIIDFDKVKELLLEKQTSTTIYEVKSGDVLGTIAEQFDLPLNELLKQNPQISIDNPLQIDEELSVQKSSSLVDVTFDQVTKVEEKIDYETIVLEDKKLEQGKSYVQDEGKPGKKEVTYKMTVTNKKVTTKDVISEKVIEQKKDKVVVKGVKRPPSTGDGNFIWPTNGGIITTYQGYRWGSYHKGIDIAKPNNYNISAADRGTITFAGWINGYGNTVQINHNNGYSTQYAHLASISVKKGDTVNQGNKIGIMGSTGFSTGIHLDFEVYYRGKLLNPMDFLPGR